jgi:tRNA(Met) C34 N-acetyltransferase TmcA
MMSLYVSSHYKNSPNDLLLMSDAPAHHIFALLGPVDTTKVRQRAREMIGQRRRWTANAPLCFGPRKTRSRT